MMWFGLLRSDNAFGGVESWDVVTQLCMSSVGLIGERGLANAVATRFKAQLYAQSRQLTGFFAVYHNIPTIVHQADTHTAA